MDSLDWQAIALTLYLAAMTTGILLIIATPLAWWLAHWRHPAKPIVHAIIALPLVLPPTVLGFYLLVAFSPQYALGEWWVSVSGNTLAFSFTGILIGSVFYSLPFAVQPLVNAFEQLNPQFIDVAKSMQLTSMQRWRKVILPLTKPAFILAAGLSFAHTVGEFGVVLMIGGNIPGETRVVSIALFEHVESMNYQQAHQLAFILLLFSMIFLALLYRLQKRRVGSWM